LKRAASFNPLDDFLILAAEGPLARRHFLLNPGGEVKGVVEDFSVVSLPANRFEKIGEILFRFKFGAVEASDLLYGKSLLSLS